MGLCLWGTGKAVRPGCPVSPEIVVVQVSWGWAVPALVSMLGTEPPLELRRGLCDSGLSSPPAVAEPLIARGHMQVLIGRREYKLKISPCMSGDIANLQVTAGTLVPSSTWQPRARQHWWGVLKTHCPHCHRPKVQLLRAAPRGPFPVALLLPRAAQGCCSSACLCPAPALPLPQDRPALEHPRRAG